MLNRKNARLLALALVVIFSSSIALLLARQLNLGPERPAPDFRTFGPQDAPVQIYEYTDLSCPACRATSEIINRLMEVFGPGLRVQFKHYPLLGIHPWSLHAAAFADCAGEQGKFKEYADSLFNNQADWAANKTEPEAFRLYAEKLGLDWQKMKICSQAPETLKTLKLDIAEAELKGVNATPTFFINGRRAVGPGQLLEQAKKFDNLLKKAAKR